MACPFGFVVGWRAWTTRQVVILCAAMHDDARAADTAVAVGALAYTVGST
jgi:hypothetical protein